MPGRKVEKSASGKTSYIKKAKLKRSGRKNTFSRGNRFKPSNRGASSAQSNYERSPGEKKAPEEAKMMQEEPGCYAEEARSVSHSLTDLCLNRTLRITYMLQDDSKTMEIVTEHLNSILHSREHPKTICPSEVARALSRTELSDVGVSDWRHLMNPVRAILFDMRSKGQVEILQRGKVIPQISSLEEIRGPIRARLVPLQNT
ncbi:MAG: hypothetical protein Q9196_002928 [Gyalolechia fulgens]